MPDRRDWILEGQRGGSASARRRGLGALAGALCVLAGPSLAFAQEAKTTPAAILPVRDVTLFSSGVSYTLRQGQVEGDAAIPLTFRSSQINDILKSMVLLDTKGTVRPAIYAAKDPIGRTLQSFAVDVSQPTDRVSLLNRLKGARIAVEGGGTVIAASTMTEKFSFEGQLVGVDKEATRRGGEPGNVLTLLGTAGLQSIDLDEVRTIRFLDDAINREFREALSVQASGSDDNRKLVTLHFDGAGTRAVRVGYVSEAPLWKISYRLLIGGSGTGDSQKPYLQGWALVENTSDEDWTNIHLSLVSGRPVSFIQDLYQPLYLPRPVVPPDVVASPFPQLSDANIVEKKDNEAVQLPGTIAVAGAPAVAGGFGGGGGFSDSVSRTRGRISGIRGSVVANDMDNAVTNGAMFASVQSAAAGEKVGELFQYSIETPVTLPRQQAAMIPVVAQNIGGEKVSIYNADTDPRFPLNAFRIRNDTPLHLKGGPITIFDEGVYAGDARVEDVPPGDSRLVTYAVDLAVTGERIGPSYSGQETSLSLKHGVLIVRRMDTVKTKYTLVNKASKPRLVIVEHPYNSDYKLVKPAAEPRRTATHYRFEVPVAASKTESLDVVTQRLDSQTIALLDAGLNSLQVYAGRSDVAASIKDSLGKVIALRTKVTSTQSTISGFDNEANGITADQDRIRKNMTELDRNSALYKRYVGELDAGETRIQTIRLEQTRLRGVAASADQELRAYLNTLDIAP